jgi:hypothetical protein
MQGCAGHGCRSRVEERWDASTGGRRAQRVAAQKLGRGGMQDTTTAVRRGSFEGQRGRLRRGGMQGILGSWKHHTPEALQRKGLQPGTNYFAWLAGLDRIY